MYTKFQNLRDARTCMQLGTYKGALLRDFLVGQMQCTVTGKGVYITLHVQVTQNLHIGLKINRIDLQITGTSRHGRGREGKLGQRPWTLEFQNDDVKRCSPEIYPLTIWIKYVLIQVEGTMHTCS